MDEMLAENLTKIATLVKELVKNYKNTKEENSQLHSLVAAMETDYKKAGRLLNEHEKLLKDRDRLKTKITELLEKFDKLRI